MDQNYGELCDGEKTVEFITTNIITEKYLKALLN